MVKQSKREVQREATIAAIKAAARDQMARTGSAAISLREVARDIGVTAPALYRYFANRDDLITDLLVEAFNGIADAMVEADVAQPRDDYARRLIAVLMAYRQWALDHATDFQLMYGNPIPGYDAPRELTVPAAARAFIVVVGILGEALAAGVLQPPVLADDLPPSVAENLQGVMERDGYEAPINLLYIGTVGWTRINGMIMLELLNDTQAIVGDTAAFYQFEVTKLCTEMNLYPKS